MRWCMRALRSSPLLLAPSAADLYVSILCCRASAKLLGAGRSVQGAHANTHLIFLFNMQHLSFLHFPYAALWSEGRFRIRANGILPAVATWVGAGAAGAAGLEDG